MSFQLAKFLVNPSTLGSKSLTTNTANSYLHKIDITIHLCHSLSPNLPGQNQHRFSEIMFPFPQNSTAEMQKSEQSHLAPSFTLPLSISCQFKSVQIIANPKCLNMVIDNHSQPWIFFRVRKFSPGATFKPTGQPAQSSVRLVSRR